MADQKTSSWSEHEILVCLMNVIDKCGLKLEFDSVAYPPGRSANGFRQKINALKKSLKPEIDAINDGQPISDAPVATPKKVAGRKRRTDEADGEKPAPKKRGRAKKAVEQPESEVDEEDFVKTESGEEIKAEDKEV